MNLNGIDVSVPGDPSSALFPIIAALICKNSDIISQKCFNKSY